MGINTRNRIYSLDLLRGLVMVIMALDHTRDFFHYDAFLHDPLDVSTTSPYLYFTRWITHYCAPVFVFLAGTSIRLQGLRKNVSELSAFLFKRGLWLIFVEVILITFAWTFDFSFRVIVLQVIWAIGISMVLMGFIIRLPSFLILLLGSIIVFGHNVLDSVDSTHSGLWWDLLRNGNFAYHTFGEAHTLVIIYPFVPWLGLMMLGYCFGNMYQPSFDSKQRKNLLIMMGTGVILFFMALRFSNLYGDPTPWSFHSNGFLTALSYLNVHKYPPSLLYLSVTIGPALLFLAFFENINNKFSKTISIYGRVPFFYYIVHFYILHVLCMILFVARGHSLSEDTPDIFGIPFNYLIVGEGYSLTVVYIIWILLVIALYPLCKWFSNFKKSRNFWWLSYL